MILGVDEAKVRLQLRQDELKDAREGRSILRESSATTFLVVGLQIEWQQ